MRILPHRLGLFICLFLVLATASVYWPVLNNEFVKFDDDRYITENPDVLAGLTWEGISWAFSTTHAEFWHPLTWLSLMLDCEIYGFSSKGCHLTNLLFHLANTILLFLVLLRMTNLTWQSAFVAGLFALHPLHVESVAWVAQRKDVLSTFFWMLTMFAYAHYVENRRFSRYFLVVLCFVLGLMSKPTLVTLPFVLILLDYWPLGRVQPGRLERVINRETPRLHNQFNQKAMLRLVVEKAPLFLLSAIMSVVTFVIQKEGGAMLPLEEVPLTMRVANALVAYVSYIRDMFWPHNLAVFYPLPLTFHTWQVAGACLALVAISVLIFRSARQYPFLPVGWLWYLGTLLPVIGVVKIALFARADRYTYISLIGLYIIIAWGVPEIVKAWRYRRSLLFVSAGMLYVALMICSRMQIGNWKDTTTLFAHKFDVTTNNYAMHESYGHLLMSQGKLEEAIGHFSKALRIKPDYGEVHHHLALAYFKTGHYQAAIDHCDKAVELGSRVDPRFLRLLRRHR